MQIGDQVSFRNEFGNLCYGIIKCFDPYGCKGTVDPDSGSYGLYVRKILEVMPL